MRPVLCVAAALLVGQGVIGADDVVSREALTAAAQKSLDLLVKTSPAFIKKGGCNSCHNQTLRPRRRHLPGAAASRSAIRSNNCHLTSRMRPSSGTPSIQWREAAGSMRSPPTVRGRSGETAG